jgi:hypothetical protein
MLTLPYHTSLLHLKPKNYSFWTNCVCGGGCVWSLIVRDCFGSKPGKLGMAKQSKYSSSKKSDGDLEELSEKLANDLRFHIRTLV